MPPYKSADRPSHLSPYRSPPAFPQTIAHLLSHFAIATASNNFPVFPTYERSPSKNGDRTTHTIGDYYIFGFNFTVIDLK